ncbi:MAG: hypothetical protein WD382_11360 [Halofilum sp. (in: g-proteobacteria)]
MDQPNVAAGCGRRGWLLAAALLFAPLQPAQGETEALEFRGTPWAAAADRHGLEPGLLYALTLVESRHRSGPDRVSPWPWTIHGPGGGRWFDSQEEARAALAEMLERWPAKRIDVGAAQINVGWHEDIIDDPLRLLDLDYNLEVAAQILARAVQSTSDPVLGVGRYHAWVDQARSRRYGRKVWRMYSDLLAGRGSTVGRYVLGPEDGPAMAARQLAENR